MSSKSITYSDSIHFEPTDEGYNEALAKFKELSDSGKYANIWLIASHHWASEGYWIEFKQPDLDKMDVIEIHFKRHGTDGGSQENTERDPG